MKFNPVPLSRERLAVIYGAIEKNGGEITTRNLDRIHGVTWLEVKQAEEAGFIFLEARKPKRGRPSLLARKVSKPHPTKRLPLRSSLERRISPRHWDFAFWYVVGECGPGRFDFRRRAYVAYQKAYPKSRSKAGAKASASRLLRKPHIQAAIQWSFAKNSGECRGCSIFPQTTTEIWNALREIGSARAKWAPWAIRRKWEREEI